MAERVIRREASVDPDLLDRDGARGHRAAGRTRRGRDSSQSRGRAARPRRTTAASAGHDRRRREHSARRLPRPVGHRHDRSSASTRRCANCRANCSATTPATRDAADDVHRWPLSRRFPLDAYLARIARHRARAHRRRGRARRRPARRIDRADGERRRRLRGPNRAAGRRWPSKSSDFATAACSPCRSATRPASVPAIASSRRGGAQTIPVGDELLGRVIDGFGRPIDGLGALRDAPPASAARRAAQSAGARADRDADRHGRARD